MRCSLYSQECYIVLGCLVSNGECNYRGVVLSHDIHSPLSTLCSIVIITHHFLPQICLALGSHRCPAGSPSRSLCASHSVVCARVVPSEHSRQRAGRNRQQQPRRRRKTMIRKKMEIRKRENQRTVFCKLIFDFTVPQLWKGNSVYSVKACTILFF